MTDSEHKRATNSRLGELLQIADVDRPIAFFCECDDPTCYQPVWLTLAEYGWKRPRSLLVAGSHTSGDTLLRAAA